MTMQFKLACKLALAVSGLILAGASASAQAPYRPLTGPMMLNPGALQIYAPKLNCFIGGTPVEFPDDVVLANVGVSTIQPGTKVHWSIQNYQGDYTFSAPLTPNHVVSISGAVGAHLGAGTPCNVNFV
jgi:hypothetical protein